MSEWVYYILYDPPGTSTSPHGLLRQRRDALPYDAQVLRADGRWWPSDLPGRIFLGHSDHGELKEITEQQAETVIRKWIKTGRIPSWPRDVEIPQQ